VQDKETALENPPLEVTVQELLPLPPCWTVRLEGLQETAKFGVGAAVTVSAMVAERVSDPPVPEAWMVKVPVEAVPEALMVRLLLALPFAGGVTGLGA
jgi:hypothetical protein